MNDGKRERERVEERANRRGRQEGESARERGKNGGREGKRKERFLLVAPPRIQSHRVYSSVHLILFIGFKAFAGTPYLRI